MSKLPEHKQTTKGARKFGFTMAAILALIGGYLFWTNSSATWAVGGVGAAFFMLALLVPRSLIPVEKLWLRFGEAIGSVVSILILSLTFIFIFVPWGLFLRLIGKDLLSLRIDKAAKSYWCEVEADGPCSRPFAPY